MLSFAQRLKNREKLCGTFVTLPSPEVAELLALSGFDWLWLDAEHAPLDFLTLQRMIQAVAKRAACLVRLPLSEPSVIGRLLDMGCDGLIAPQIHTAQAARQFVRAMRYPPEGTRGVGLARAAGYGLGFQENLERANQELVALVQIESAEAVNNVEAILETPGLDGVIVGPNDLAATMGFIGKTLHPEVQSAIQRVVESAVKASLPIGVFTGDTEEAKRYESWGATLIPVGADVLFLAHGAKKTLETMKG